MKAKPRRHGSRVARGAMVALIVVAAGCGASAASTGGTSASGTGAGGSSTSTTTAGTVGAGGAGGGAEALPLVALQLAVGRSHSCALVAGGTVACWGAGDRGQLGDGVASADHHRALPQVIPGLSEVKALRAGGDTTCALVGATGKVQCWGAGAFGQLGNGKAEDGYLEASPVDVYGLEGAIDLSVSGPNACAVLMNGTVRCWGRNDPGSWLGFASADCGPYIDPDGTGDPTPVTRPCEPSPKEVPLLVDATQISAGGAHICALRTGGAVSCWGADAFGQLGDGTFGPGNHQVAPTAIVDLLGVSAIHAGGSHTCALLANQKMACWGDNAHGQLGQGTDALDSYKTVPTAVPGLSAVIAVDAAARASCAITDDRLVHCWGDVAELFATLPDPTKTTVLSPVTIPELAFAIEVRTGGAHACARKATNNVVCWGKNDQGQLGNGGVKAHDYTLVPVAF